MELFVDCGYTVFKKASDISRDPQRLNLILFCLAVFSAILGSVAAVAINNARKQSGSVALDEINDDFQDYQNVNLSWLEKFLLCISPLSNYCCLNCLLNKTGEETLIKQKEISHSFDSVNETFVLKLKDDEFSHTCCPRRVFTQPLFWLGVILYVIPNLIIKFILQVLSPPTFLITLTFCLKLVFNVVWRGVCCCEQLGKSFIFGTLSFALGVIFISMGDSDKSIFTVCNSWSAIDGSGLLSFTHMFARESADDLIHRKLKDPSKLIYVFVILAIISLLCLYMFIELMQSCYSMDEEFKDQEYSKLFQIDQKDEMKDLKKALKSNKYSDCQKQNLCDQMLMKINNDKKEKSCLQAIISNHSDSLRCLIYAIGSGICTANAALLIKVVCILFVNSLFNLTLLHRTEILFNLIIIIIILTILQMMFLNYSVSIRGLQFIIPIRKATILLNGLIGAAILLETGPENYRFILFGIFLLIIGVTLIHGCPYKSYAAYTNV